MIVISKGPPVTVKVYQPSLLKVPIEQPVAVGVFWVASVMLAVELVIHAPFTVIDVAVSHLVPCENKLFVKEKKIKKALTKS